MNRPSNFEQLVLRRILHPQYTSLFKNREVRTKKLRNIWVRGNIGHEWS